MDFERYIITNINAFGMFCVTQSMVQVWMGVRCFIVYIRM